MPDLKLRRLPERTPVKMTISLPPALSDALGSYAALYNEAYGVEEPLCELIPAMLEAFLESDRSFVQRRRAARPK